MKKRDTFFKILRYLKPHAPFLFLTILLAIVEVAASLAAPYLAGRAIDCLIGKGEVDFSALSRLFLAFSGCAGTAAISQYLLSLSNNRIAYHVLKEVRKEAFFKVQRLPLRYLDGRAHGEIASTIITDAEQFSDGLLLGFTQLFTGAATILGVLVILFAMRWEIALIVVLLTPFSFLSAKFISFKTYRLFQEQSRLRAEQTAYLDETISNLKLVKAFSHEKKSEEEFHKINDRLKKSSLEATFYSSTTNPVTRFLNALVYALVAVFGAFLVLKTKDFSAPFTVGALSAVLSYATQYTKPFNEITEVFAEFQNALACAARLFALKEEEAEPSEEGKLTLARPKGEIEFQNVGFSYTEGKKVLSGLTFSAPAGKKIALVGPTGCGKTTLINLLMRFYEIDEGTILLDGNDLRSIQKNSLRSSFGMVLQDTWLKSETVRENLCMGREISEEEMIGAAKAAHAHGFIMRLKKGYDTVLNEEGTLSEGQRQLLCIARVMLLKPSMLILDEATSNIDTRTERKVQSAFEALMKGKTCFIVAHRLSTIEHADLILVLKDGKIAEAGTHGELLKKKGAYYAIYSAQFAN